MTILEEVTTMTNQGIPENEIINSLQQRGISPREIDDALSQSKIKSAVSNERVMDMKPSIMEPPAPSSQEQNYIPKTQEVEGFQEPAYAPQQNYAQPEEYYSQDSYEGYPSAGGTSTMIEVANQVFSEKIKKIQKQVEDMTEFKTLAQTKIINMAERLQRIEATLDKLQLAILDKIGSYGKNLESIKKEMSMMQDSFGKVVNQAIKGAQPTTPKNTSKKK